jgi:broad specificity phosphatase PhoE
VGPVLTDPQLRERHAGPWEGLTRKEIEVGWPGYLDDYATRPEGWEGDEALLERTHRALADIRATYEGADVLVIAHGGLVYALERSHGLEFQRLPNLAGRWLTHHGERVELHERVVLVDDELLTSVPAQI